MAAETQSTHVCPWWLGYVLVTPLRKFFQHPEKILAPFVREGMTVLEVGSGMGFFTLALARLVESSGRVICVDIQEKMLSALLRRVRRAGFAERVVAVRADEHSLRIEDYQQQVDFALLFAVAHEVPDQGRLFEQIGRSLKPGGSLLFSEPAKHVTEEEFRRSIDVACSKGFEEKSALQIRWSLSVLLTKVNRT